MHTCVWRRGIVLVRVEARMHVRACNNEAPKEASPDEKKEEKKEASSDEKKRKKRSELGRDIAVVSAHVREATRRRTLVPMGRG